MPGTVVTATITGGGTVLVDDSGAVTAIGLMTTAIAANTAALEQLFGPTAAATPGLTAIVSGQAEHIRDISKGIGDLASKFEDLSTAINGVSKGNKDILTALANIQFTLLETKTIQTLAYADQSRNNQFQQKATNQALVDAGKPPIEVKQEEFVAATKQSLVDVGYLNAQVAATNIIQEYVVAGITKGYAISLEWIAQTSFGTFVQDYFAIAKIQTQLLYADDKTARALREQLAVIRARRTNPTG